MKNAMCPGCSRTEEGVTKQGRTTWRPIQLTKKTGECVACNEANAEAAYDDRLRRTA
jgi:hypothetical protein